MTSTPAVLLTLPPELIEAIVIVANSPKTISALARTCRSLHALVYNSQDSHLWRALFLATWDDPRPALSHMALLDPRAGEREDAWDWGVEYRRRAQGERWLRKWRQGICVAGAEDSPAWANTVGDIDSSVLLATLNSLISTLQTLTPFPASPPIALTVLTPEISPFPTGNVGSGVGERRERMTSSPPLPPLLLLLASGRIVYGPHTTTSKPSMPTPRVATPCLPPQLTRTLLPSLTIGVRGFHPHTPALTPAEYWENSKLADIFHRIVCITGFVPVPPPLASLSPAPEGTCNSFPPSAAQYADARALARRRVYDMRYLMANRMWGPYHVVRRSASPTGRQNMSAEPANPRNDNGDLVDEDEGEQELPLISLILTPPTSAPSSGRTSHRSARSQMDDDGLFEIKPHHLRPDYTYLASVRIVVEANLRELFGSEDRTRTFEFRDILYKFRTLEVARIGGACGYWSNWIGRMESIPRARWSPGEGDSLDRRNDKRAGNDDPEKEHKGKGKAREVEGWDWAGVAGIWRRCVCWMDYRELLCELTQTLLSFLSLGTFQACRIIPMEVRIEKYARAGIMPSKYRPPRGHTRYFRPPPVIHFVGSSIGSDRSLDDGRIVRGTVSMIGSGEVRWTMLSFVPHTTKPEWSSEAIQIGGPGSAVGILGMWTGAGHERADPLGPFWAWKVA
ncbi:hypothetical protein F5I97DRAFT_1808060 [Phlebopus sp. FC_14]|nr:hypothetical protein F5I97DRAFT_1808060 [Phlebopus sp. FC_14]